ncbi:MAG: ABC transporter substrate-binding protein [Gammaproteobacteria bacterium]|jgi:phospholipid transport system substrate-binding protein
MNRYVAISVLVFSFFSVLAVPAYAFAEEHPAQKLVVETSKEIMARLEKEESVVRAESDRLYQIVDEMILPHFDFTSMSQYVLGRYWRKASEDQKKRFSAEFQKLLVRTYSNALLEAIGKKITYLPLKSKKEDADEVTVRTEVEQKGGFPIPIDYKMHLKNNEWKVWDVTIDNVSLVANYRTSFAKEIKDAGIDKLIDDIAERNSQRKPS